MVGKGEVREAPKGLSAKKLFPLFLLRRSPSLTDAYLKSCTQGAIIFKATKSPLLRLLLHELPPWMGTGHLEFTTLQETTEPAPETDTAI